MRIASALFALAAIGLLAGCSSSPSTAVSTHSTHVKVPTGTTTATTPRAAGTRANPIPLNTPGKYSNGSMWTFTFTAVNGDAEQAVDAFGMSKTVPAGMKDVLGTVTIAAGTTDQSENPYTNVGFAYVGSDGNTYPADQDSCGHLGNSDLLDAEPMYQGASKSFYICAQVPGAAVSGGTWTAYYDPDQSSIVFFKGA